MSVPSLSDSLDQWLSWLECLHPTEIEMGLDRVGRVADRMGLRPSAMPLILVGGTNGKGSTVALLSEIYCQAGYRVGAYTSPHIELFNERMCVDGEMLSDQTIVNALHEVELSRGPDTITYFEYTTLAAMVAFRHLDCDVVIMEVGLGGRLDATNLWDCDCAILTSIALDHQAYLGDTLEAIAAEKVAIGRPDKPLIVGEVNPPANLFELAKADNMQLIHVDSKATLPRSALAGVHQQRNAACALMAVERLQKILPVDASCVQRALETVRLPGRFEQCVINSQATVFDVAHNPAAASVLRDLLIDEYADYDVFAVFSALKDKDIGAIAEVLSPAVTSWFVASLDVPRAVPVNELVQLVSQAQTKPVSGHDSIEQAWLAARNSSSSKPSVVLVAGSFFTVAQLRSDLAVGKNPVAEEKA